MKTSCENCRYSDITMITMDETDLPHLVCRRYPPQLFGTEQGRVLWPLVHEAEWCGEFLKKQDTFVTNT